ncbi:acyl-CoA thioesterase [Companilactobacillus furfuricola]|uniref:acyl-CoA thioesterase n=1 Tax=Companilactobacillus furfuricola TaxID=1462575 RepID=UPI000F7728B7|nr:acyl-CoA thioesterase [Companilactobacillus furfuricola]
MKEINVDQTRAISERLVFDGDLNDKGTLFGGKILSLLDENAGLAAFKYVNVKFATANYDHMNFWNPITTKDSIKIESIVTGASGRSIEVFTKILKTDLKTNETKLAFTSFCTLVTLRQFGQIDFPKLLAPDEEAKFLLSGYGERLEKRRSQLSEAKDFVGHLSLDK